MYPSIFTCINSKVKSIFVKTISFVQIQGGDSDDFSAKNNPSRDITSTILICIYVGDQTSNNRPMVARLAKCRPTATQLSSIDGQWSTDEKQLRIFVMLIRIVARFQRVPLGKTADRRSHRYSYIV